VKICNLYGDGFYYLPGTDICVKIGGYVRAEYAYLGGSSMTNEQFNGGPSVALAGNGVVTNAGSAGFQNRWDGPDFVMRSRAYVSMDTRQQTEFGILRTYINIGLVNDTPQTAPVVLNINRAFIQFSGFTVGLAQIVLRLLLGADQLLLGHHRERHRRRRLEGRSLHRQFRWRRHQHLLLRGAAPHRHHRYQCRDQSVHVPARHFQLKRHHRCRRRRHRQDPLPRHGL
jgi:hypothetical protein